ncbi:MAG: GNAT family N-acetyltransferase [Anaerolineae bacterium]|nr:GNAT family N-acetyltransferase [Anaerolineae bacterium]
MKAAIRLIQPDDFEQLAYFFEENNRPEVTRLFTAFPLTRETARQIALDDHEDRYYLALQDHRIVGLVMLRGWDEGYDVPSIGIFIDYRRQGEGLGRCAVEFVVEEARRLGCKRARATHYAANQRMGHIFETLGFEEFDRQPVTVHGEEHVKVFLMKHYQEN